MVAPLLQDVELMAAIGLLNYFQSVQQSAVTERIQPAGAEVTARCLALSMGREGPQYCRR